MRAPRLLLLLQVALSAGGGHQVRKKALAKENFFELFLNRNGLSTIKMQGFQRAVPRPRDRHPPRRRPLLRADAEVRRSAQAATGRLLRVRHHEGRRAAHLG